MKEADGGEDSSLSSSLWSLGRRQKAIMAGRGFSLIKAHDGSTYSLNTRKRFDS